MESPLCPPDDPDFRLIETFRWEPGSGVIRRAGHLARLRRSADSLGITPRGLDAALDGITGAGPLRVRLTVDRAGRVEVGTAPFAPLDKGTVWHLAVAEARLHSDNAWLRHKTTRRQVYDAARAALPEGVDEAIFLNERNELCEGTITNLFVTIGSETLTPALSCGLLPGVLRAERLAGGACKEAVLTLDDLLAADAIHVGNSLRGLIRAALPVHP